MSQEDTSPQATNEEEHFQDNGNQDTLGIGDLPTPPPPAGSWSMCIQHKFVLSVEQCTFF